MRDTYFSVDRDKSKKRLAALIDSFNARECLAEYKTSAFVRVVVQTPIAQEKQSDSGVLYERVERAKKKVRKWVDLNQADLPFSLEKVAVLESIFAREYTDFVMLLDVDYSDVGGSVAGDSDCLSNCNKKTVTIITKDIIDRKFSKYVGKNNKITLLDKESRDYKEIEQYFLGNSKTPLLQKIQQAFAQETDANKLGLIKAELTGFLKEWRRERVPGKIQTAYLLSKVLREEITGIFDSLFNPKEVKIELSLECRL
ncbi:MAG: hypothetical protein FWB72_03670 [Firmicutes bacterium]|nr:hypothetical protein [Bacillota bacterium]